jgi:hypothetical protein
MTGINDHEENRPAMKDKTHQASTSPLSTDVQVRGFKNICVIIFYPSFKIV